MADPRVRSTITGLTIPRTDNTELQRFCELVRDRLAQLGDESARLGTQINGVLGGDGRAAPPPPPPPTGTPPPPPPPSTPPPPGPPPPPPPPPISEVPLLATPPTPVGLEAFSGISSILLSWQNPFRLYSNHGNTIVYRGATDRFDEASRLGVAAYMTYIDSNITANTQYYYWIVFESATAVEGRPSESVSVTAASDPEDVFDNLETWLNTSPLNQALQSPIQPFGSDEAVAILEETRRLSGAIAIIVANAAADADDAATAANTAATAAQTTATAAQNTATAAQTTATTAATNASTAITNAATAQTAADAADTAATAATTAASNAATAASNAQTTATNAQNLANTLRTDLSTLETTVGTKADASDLTTLETTVQGKANTSALNALTTRVTTAEGTITSQSSDITSLTSSVADKADTSALNALTTTVTTQGTTIAAHTRDISALEASLVGRTLGPTPNSFGSASTANQADAEALRDTQATSDSAWLAQYDADDDLNIQLSWGSFFLYQRRVNNAWVNNGDTQVRAAAITQLSADVATNTNEISGLRTDKADASDLTALETTVGGKANTSALNALTTRVSTEEGNVDTLQSDLSTLQTTVGTKADASDVTALETTVQGKANTSALTALTTRVSTAETTLGTKADSSDLTALTSTVNTNTSNITSLTSTVNTKANTSALTALTTRVSTAETTLGTKADSTDLTTLETTVNTKADSSDLTSLQTTVQGKADTSALNALTTRVSTAEGNITTQSSDITSLTSRLGGLDVLTDVLTLQLPASADADAFETDVAVGEEIEITPSGELASTVEVHKLVRDGSKFTLNVGDGTTWSTSSLRIVKGGNTYTLSTNVAGADDVDAANEWHVDESVRIPIGTQDLERKADATAVENLDTRVTSAEGNITTNTTNITSLNTSLADKADANALTTLQATVTQQGSDIATNTMEITALESSIVGRALGPEQNTFGDSNTADRDAAEALRDAYATANPTWLPQYDDDDDHNVRLQWGFLFVYQRRVNNAWVDNGDVQAQASAVSQLSTDVTSLSGRVDTAETDIATERARVTSNATAITNLRTNLGTKADNSALTSLRSTVTQQGNRITTNASNVTNLTARVGGLDVDTDVLTIQIASASADRFADDVAAGEDITITPAGRTASTVRVHRAVRDDDKFVVNVGEGIVWGTGSVQITKGSNTYTAATNVTNDDDVDAAGEWHVEENVRIPIGTQDLERKADGSALQSLDTRVTQNADNITSQSTSITNLSNSLGNKADSSDVTALATRVSTAETTLGTKADSSDLTALTSTVNTKANASDLTTLETTVQGKANTSALNALTTRVSTAETTLNSKADQSDLTTLETTVGTKADASDLTALETTVNGKANTSALNALTTRVSTAETTLNSKADQSDLTTLETTVSTKADSTDLTTLETTVQGKANTSALNALTTRVATEEGNVDTLQSDLSTLQTTVGTKADASDVTALETTVQGKANTSALTALTTRVSTTETTLGTKADQTDLDTLETTVNTKADASDVTALETTVNGKANTSALNALTTRVSTEEGNVDTLQSDLSTLQTTVSTKADASDLTTLETTVGTKANTTALNMLSTRVDTNATNIASNSQEITALEAAVGGRTLGPEQNMFGDATTADKAAAEALRDTYASANPTWLAEYDADNDKNIELRWGVQYIYQRRVSSAWVDNGEPLARVAAVSQLNTSVTSNTNAISGLRTSKADASDVTALETTVAGKANTSALNALTSRVTTAENTISTHTSTLTTLRTDVDTKASTSALTALTNRVTTAEGTISTQTSNITTLQNTVANKANTSALNALTTRVDTAEGTITSQSTSITTLTSSIAGKADSSAVQTLDTKVTNIENVSGTTTLSTLSRWLVKTQVDDLVGGIGLYNDGTNVDFILRADRVSFVTPDWVGYTNIADLVINNISPDDPTDPHSWIPTNNADIPAFITNLDTEEAQDNVRLTLTYSPPRRSFTAALGAPDVNNDGILQWDNDIGLDMPSEWFDFRPGTTGTPTATFQRLRLGRSEGGSFTYIALGFSQTGDTRATRSYPNLISEVRENIRVTLSVSGSTTIPNVVIDGITGSDEVDPFAWWPENYEQLVTFIDSVRDNNLQDNVSVSLSYQAESQTLTKDLGEPSSFDASAVVVRWAQSTPHLDFPIPTDWFTTSPATAFLGTIRLRQRSDATGEITFYFTDDLNTASSGAGPNLKEDVRDNLQVRFEVLSSGKRPFEIINGEVFLNELVVREGTIGTAHIGDGAIDNAKIGTGAIQRANISYGAIGSAEIERAEITSAHIDRGQILEAHITNAAITEAKIADASITSAKIRDVIQSDNYTSGDNGVGWQINRDGSAFFDAASIRGEITAEHISADVRSWRYLWNGGDSGWSVPRGQNRTLVLSDDYSNYHLIALLFTTENSGDITTHFPHFGTFVGSVQQNYTLVGFGRNVNSGESIGFNFGSNNEIRVLVRSVDIILYRAYGVTLGTSTVPASVYVPPPPPPPPGPPPPKGK